MSDETKQESMFKRPPAWGSFKKAHLIELPPDEELIGFDPPAGMVKSIEDVGIRVPVILEELEEPYQVPDEELAGTEGDDYEVVREVRYRVRDGRRRIKAARRLGIEAVPAQVFAPGESDAALTVITNAHRSENPAAEYEAVKRLAEDHELPPREIAQELGIHANRVKRLMRLGALIEPLTAAFLDGRIRPTAAFEAARLSESIQGALAEELEEEGKLTVTRVREAKQVRVQRQLQEGLDDDLFDTPAAPEPEPAAPDTELFWREVAYQLALDHDLNVEDAVADVLAEWEESGVEGDSSVPGTEDRMISVAALQEALSALPAGIPKDYPHSDRDFVLDHLRERGFLDPEGIPEDPGEPEDEDLGEIEHDDDLPF